MIDTILYILQWNIATFFYFRRDASLVAVHVYESFCPTKQNSIDCKSAEQKESIWMEEYSNLASSGWKKIFPYFQTKIFFNFHPVVRGLRGPRTDKNSCSIHNPKWPTSEVFPIFVMATWTARMDDEPQQCELLYTDPWLSIQAKVSRHFCLLICLR